MGNKAPSAANLDQWLKEHPGYEVVRSGGKVVTAKVSSHFFNGITIYIRGEVKFWKEVPINKVHNRD